MKQHHRNQKGAIGGIPEQVIAIAIGVLMVAGMIALGSRAFSGSKGNMAMADLNSIITGTRELFNGQSYGLEGVLLTPTLIEAHVIPPNLVTGTNTAASPWGGDLTVWPHGPTPGFSIAYTGVPQSECIQMLTKTPSEGMRLVRVNHGTSGSDTLIYNFPISLDVAAHACDLSYNSIEWATAY